MPEIKTRDQNETLSPMSTELLARSRAVEIDDTLIPTRAEFESIYKVIPAFSQKLLQAYKELMHGNNLDPGEVRLYVVGGRVKGTPIKLDSDIDLIFTVDRFKQSPAYPLHKENAGIIMKLQIRERVKIISKELGIRNHFHILDFGSTHPKQEADSKQRLLLGRL